jgi:hypothetical protein
LLARLEARAGRYLSLCARGLDYCVAGFATGRTPKYGNAYLRGLRVCVLKRFARMSEA